MRNWSYTGQVFPANGIQLILNDLLEISGVTHDVNGALVI